MAKRILLVDDEPLIVKGLKYTLEQEGFETDSAADGDEALTKFFAGHYDFILLDVMLPKVDGITVCQRIREHSNVPIIMLTAKGEQIDKILGLEYGADDYMTKPFNILEVKARIKTILRRTAASSQNDVRRTIRVHDMEINSVNRSVTLGGNEVRLTAKEFDLLQVFVNNRGKVVQPGVPAGNRVEVRLHRRRPHRGRPYPSASREDRTQSRPARIYLHQMGSGLLFHRQGLNMPFLPSDGRSCSPSCSSWGSATIW